MKYADIKEFDVANGTGIRVSLFVSGCRHKCKGCFNYEAWDFNYGKEYTKQTEQKIIDFLSKNMIRGLSFLGGEPLEPENQMEVSNLIMRVKNELPQKDIWLYSGFTFEQIMQNMYGKLPYTKSIIDNIDILVDGKFDIDKKDLRLKFRGSSNQRIIDVKEELKKLDINRNPTLL